MKRTRDISGTSLQGRITTTRRKLTEAFGEPTICEDSKVTLQWGLLFEGEGVVTIYDWKRYELGEPSQDEEITYHIGGLSPKAVEKVEEVMSEKVGA